MTTQIDPARTPAGADAVKKCSENCHGNVLPVRNIFTPGRQPFWQHL